MSVETGCLYGDCAGKGPAGERKSLCEGGACRGGGGGGRFVKGRWSWDGVGEAYDARCCLGPSEP